MNIETKISGSCALYKTETVRLQLYEICVGERRHFYCFLFIFSNSQKCNDHASKPPFFFLFIFELPAEDVLVLFLCS